MKNAAEIMEMSDEALLEQLRISSTPGAISYELCERELNRRHLSRVHKAVQNLDRSSGRLELLTWALIALTALLAVPPVWELIQPLLSK